MANIIGTNGNDTLLGTNSADTIKGLAGNDTITAKEGNDTLTGGGGKDIFVYNNFGDGTDTITDFGGIGKGTNPTAGVIAEVDTIKFLGANFTARNLLLTQNGNNLEITFEGVADAKVILKNFKLENLENLRASGTTPAIGNILFDGQNSITDSFNVLDANSTDTTIGIKNTVTFLNDLDNDITGLDDSDDVVNGQGGNDKIDGKSGNDLLRGGTGNDTLIGGAGNDSLVGDTGNDSLDGGTGNDLLRGGVGNNTLNGGTGDDYLNVDDYSTGNNLLFGGDGNDDLSAYYISGNNTLKGGAGDDYFSTYQLTGNNLLFGDNGNDSFYLSASKPAPSDLVTQTVDGGTGDDYLSFYNDGATEGITSTFNATTNIGSITIGTNRVSYKNIERLYISTTVSDDFIVGTNGNDTFVVGTALDLEHDAGISGNDTIDGGTGDDTLSSYNGNATQGITSTFNATTNIGSITIGTNRVSYKNIERLEIRGTAYDDFIVGSNGNDNLDAGANGNNTILGGTGNDGLTASNGNNLLSGDDGNDYLSASGYPVYNPDSDPYFSIFFISGNNTLNGGTGDDNLNVEISSGNNLLDGGNGNDSLFASGDTYSYESGIYTVFGDNTLKGGAGDDYLNASYSSGKNLLDGGTGNDYLIVENSSDNNLLFGGDGNDSFYLKTPYIAPSSLVTQTVDGGKGDDYLTVDFKDADGGITSTFNATTNIGSITGDTNLVNYKNIERLNISGTAYDDNIVGNNGNDTLSGGYYGGNDTIDGGIGDDLLSFDIYYATEGITSTFNATTNIGLITVGSSRVSYKNIERLNISGTFFYDDKIVGSNGNDTLNGDDGNDTLTGGNGNDSLYGDDGADTFAFNSYNEGVDTIYDFNATNELIQVSATGFGAGLSIPSLQTSQFTLGTSATTSNQRFIYDFTTGALYFDQDGSASGFTKVKFAQLSAGLSLTKNNFVVV
ncbi:calcium-binding protein [Nostoc sp. DedQUE03]|uniref:beta strand repeat-containing protein n=1 Tax=Nostoc sp. DedQUE03 TaxID=3075389 RepID=UPI002AD25AAA|nr:calcium-binding protein [Nostoc sp. DedQUE03]MDZ7971850.1 calcium-binding protein [Nostoc sp. DedQUE03]MDZ8048967.1 calcium-binding protein [Nostoc sp. DedQUE02]